MHGYVQVAGDALNVTLLVGDAWQNAVPIAPAAAPPARAFLVNWAPGLTKGAFADVASLPQDTGSHGATVCCCKKLYPCMAPQIGRLRWRECHRQLNAQSTI